MDRALNIAGGLAAVGAVAVFWALVVFVIPAFIAVYVVRLFPLTGQWRRRWADRRKPPPVA